ncbi:biliverdin-producing heme oxygenase [Gramella lutea]|uniref:Biliverdin-producing heme oxygenase n=1 Tax=Christiangramia lutea TaxID=1607951 RepID=A0A9X2ABZ0_9FLAO|nr:biliverdin-producing heme oxygenase [Christiangramia lutea]MCH4823842.1 biliverdin-producing heme oxygenase [Christiangramia lutea]
MMKMLDRLREETLELHKELEKDNLANKIMDNSIGMDDYTNLLFQNYVAYKSAESEIARFLLDYSSDKTNRLKQDLSGLGMYDLEFDLEFECHNEAEALGASYVIEGSAMGGMLIGKQLKNCKNLNGIGQQQFFSGDRSSMKGWNKFLKYLRTREFTEGEVNSAATKAKDTFLLFQKAFALVPDNC